MKHKKTTMDAFDPKSAAARLTQNGGLCVLAIDTSSYRHVETEYGGDVFRRLKELFNTILAEHWGRGGCFRADDMVSRWHNSGHYHIVVLNSGREDGILPRPGVLERVADRVGRRLVNAMWAEIFRPKSERRIPACIKHLPPIAVGFASSMNNPCLNANDIVSDLLEESMRSATMQQQRTAALQREFMQSIIHRSEFLYPNFQAIFHLQSINKEDLESSQKQQSIAPIANSLFGFESLIRVRIDRLTSYVSDEDSLINGKYLRPDVLFGVAKEAKINLELDQACLKHAALGALHLPGKLMVNILPRNLYFFDSLRPLFEKRKDVVFEISESEGISNLDLMLKVREELKVSGFKMAADDFGQGFAGLENVMALRPDIIKLDRSLITHIDQDVVKQTYVKGLIEASRFLNCTVLAEGVERWEEAAYLKLAGIDLIQGFLLHKPQTVENILDQLAEQHTLKSVS